MLEFQCTKCMENNVSCLFPGSTHARKVMCLCFSVIKVWRVTSVFRFLDLQVRKFVCQ